MPASPRQGAQGAIMDLLRILSEEHGPQQAPVTPTHEFVVTESKRPGNRFVWKQVPQTARLNVVLNILGGESCVEERGRAHSRLEDLALWCILRGAGWRTN